MSTQTPVRDVSEIGDPQPGPLLQWARRRPVAAVGAALILLQLAIRSVWIANTWFAEDDFVWIERTFERPLTWDLLTESVGGHLVPGCWALSWLITTVAPYERWPAALIMIGLLALSSVLFWRLLRRLFGETPGVLVPLTLYLFWAMTTTTTLWWSTTVLWVPLQICLSAALLTQLRYLRHRRLTDAVLSTLLVAVGLFFFTKAIVIPIVVFGFTLLYGFRGSVWRRVIQTLRVCWPVWTGQIAVVAAYTWLYLAQDPSVHRAPASAGKVLDLAHNLIVVAFNTQVWGGPWSWGKGSLAKNALATPSDVALWVTGVLSLGVILLSLFAGVRSYRAWIVLAGYLALDVAMLTSARLEYMGPLVGLSDRYLSDVALVAALAVGLAFLPLRGVGAPPDAAPAGEPSGPFAVARRHPLAVRVAVSLVVSAVAISGSVSSTDLYRRWHEAPAQEYVATLRADLRARVGRTDMFDAAVPAGIVDPLVYPANRLAQITRVLPNPPRFPTWTHSFVAPDNAGHLRPGTVVGAPSVVGRTRACGWQVTAGKPTRIPLTQSVYRWEWVVRVAYFAAAETPADITLGESTVRVTLRPGANELFLRLSGEGDSVTIGGVRSGVCVGQVVVGTTATR